MVWDWRSSSWPNVPSGNAATNWYYAQFVVAASNGTYTAPAWNINFSLPAVPPNPATLTVALAGASGSGAFHVLVNGRDISPDTYQGIYTIDDTALYRDGVLRGQQQTYPIQFDASLLHAGSNTVTITVRKTGSSTWTGSRPVLPAYGIMYDCVQLEAGAQTTNTVLSQSQPVTASSYQTGNYPNNGNDGSSNSRWSASTSSFPQWWRVDLGTPHTMRSIYINWYLASQRSYKYKIEVSNDDVSYATVVDKTNNTIAGVTYDALPSTTKYRYVRVTVTGASAGWASFVDCQVFGD